MKKLITSILYFLLINLSIAQQDPQYSQYMFNQLTFNPAYAGSTDNKVSTSLFYRKQWLGSEYSPQYQNFIIHSPFNQRRNGVGFQITKSATNFFTNTDINFSYAYRIIFAKGLLSMGLNGGISYLSTNLNPLDIRDNDDAFLSNQSQTSVLPELGTGAYYQNNKFYLGISVQHLIPQTIKINRCNYHAKQINWFLNAGYKFNISNNFQIVTSGLLKYAIGFTPQFDITNHFIFSNTFWAGFSLRTNTIISLQAGVRIDKILPRLRQEVRIGYAFDVYANISRPSHEIMLMIDWEVHKSPQNIRKQKIQLSPFFL
jgi:type IX secretion system PorP/SprF family membrane protein